MKRFLALYVGQPGAGPPADMSEETIARGMQAWGEWMNRHGGQIVDMGGPVGVTKRVSDQGIADTHNSVGGYIVVQAESHEAAARMFEGHPHFAIFPGEAVEIMECLPIPGPDPL
jgi:hypothetical protein